MLLLGGYTEAMDENTPGHARGISLYDFAPADGSLTFRGYTPVTNPSYLLADQKREVVYSVCEREHDNESGVLAYRVKRGKGNKVSFEHLSTVPLPGDHPCHLAFAGDTLLVSSYTSGHVHVVRRNEDGSLGEVLQNLQLTCQHTDRGPHAHCAVYLPRREQVAVCDLGDDMLKFFDRHADGTLHARPDLHVAFPKGEGPRHVAVRPDGDWAVVNGELVGRVHLIDLREDPPRIADIVNALPERVVDEAHGAAIRIGHNGKMVYVSDRAFSVVTVLRIDERAGRLIVRDTYPSGGEHPRDLNLCPKGEWVLTANTKDDTIGVFRVDPRGGLLHFRTIKKVPSPTTLAWL